ncbi:hypothetical protein PaecuDRAFT_4173 [Paenibacillus curdlanolyticus YK9]|uniref:Uncharacterized protein n=1 Tax=Paenibacillus curdlanolyticus YK9 TaxID=717606 RepID=E0IET2_9BACL|nr:hypothetical protein [Paenibacillus curdlanolyticus]EFM09170.1 hypothetical protein PaecuDRAFT_4173 [Paenibacillus curdlanolyticus YK9]
MDYPLYKDKLLDLLPSICMAAHADKKVDIKQQEKLFGLLKEIARTYHSESWIPKNIIATLLQTYLMIEPEIQYAQGTDKEFLIKFCWELQENIMNILNASLIR